MAIKRKQKTKPGSRIPGVAVGEEVKTSIGEKKKVCFNVGGKWVFRMVDPDWRAPGRPHKVRRQKAEGRRQKTEVRGQKAEGKRIKNKRV